MTALFELRAYLKTKETRLDRIERRLKQINKLNNEVDTKILRFKRFQLSEQYEGILARIEYFRRKA